MASGTLKINIPSHFFIALNKTEEELKKEMRLYTAINFYQSGKLTIGKAAEFADQYLNGKRDFEQKIPIAVELVTQENVSNYAAYGKNE